MQKVWIGRSEGVMSFKVEGREETIDVFTTRPDTLFGAFIGSLIILWRVHWQRIIQIFNPSWRGVRTTELRRWWMMWWMLRACATDLFTDHSLWANERLPVYIVTVMMDYGTGAYWMSCPHSRDFDCQTNGFAHFAGY